MFNNEPRQPRSIPHRAGYRKRVASKLKSHAKSMIVAAMKKDNGKVFEVGEVVLVPLANVDKAKVYSQNVTGVLVKLDINRMMAQVVAKPTC
jgi:hypothetical protein